MIFQRKNINTLNFKKELKKYEEKKNIEWKKLKNKSYIIKGVRNTNKYCIENIQNFSLRNNKRIKHFIKEMEGKT